MLVTGKPGRSARQSVQEGRPWHLETIHPLAAFAGGSSPLETCRLRDPLGEITPLLSQTTASRQLGGTPRGEPTQRSGRRFKSQPSQRPTRRYDPTATATSNPHTSRRFSSTPGNQTGSFDDDHRKSTQYLSGPLGRGGSDPIEIRLGAFSGICRPAPGLGAGIPLTERM